MLRISQQDSATAAQRYYASADYYSEGQEIIGSWGGDGARCLGLEGVVDKLSFDRLCDNLHPLTGQALTVRTRSDRTVGYDFTFSVPKSVSLIYALTGDRDVLGAFREAVEETMSDTESEMKTRVRKAGRDADRLTGNMVWAEFVHTTSRPVAGVPDPQLHAHCFAFNATWDDSEDRWKAGQFRGLKADAPYFQAGFRVRLANKLQDLGFGVARKRDDFEIVGVPTAALRRFSRRTEEIEKVAAERGITDPKRKAELGAETREKKTSALTWDELRKEWDRKLTQPEREALAETHRRELPFAKPEHGEEVAITFALDHCFTREAVVPERKLLTEALKRGLGTVTVEGAKEELAGRPLIRSTVAGRDLVTTPHMLESESRLLAFARKGRGRYRPLGDADRPVSRPWLNAGQKAAVRHVLGSRDRVTLIRGAAGTGKTTLEQEIGDGLAAAGRSVVALAPTAEASRGVLRREAGFATADTVARFLTDRAMQESARAGVVLVDEASLLGTHDMLKLFDAAERVNARIVLVGDRRQNRSVSAGEPLKLLEEKAGLPVAEVREILRQSGDYLKAAQALADGNTAAGFAELDRLGWVKEVPDADRYQALAGAYLSAVVEKKRNGDPKSALVVSPTHAEAARITHAIRSELKERGALDGERLMAVWVPAHLTAPQKGDPTNYDAGDLLQFQKHAPGHPSGSRLTVTEAVPPPVEHAARFEVYRPATLAVAAGDRVRVTARGKTKDGKHALNNGALLTVRGFTLRGDVIVDHGWVIDRAFGHLAHGYCTTSFTSQGKTVDKVFIGLSAGSFPATNQRTGYVSVTRGREQVVLFTDDKIALLKAVRKPDEPMSALALAQSRHRKPSLRERLYKRLAFVRRLATFAQTHEPRQRDEGRLPHRERGHER